MQWQASNQLSRFLRNETLQDEPLLSSMQDLVVQKIYTEAQKTGKPIFCIVDDTIASKTISLSKVIHPIEAAEFHFSEFVFIEKSDKISAWKKEYKATNYESDLTDNQWKEIENFFSVRE